MENAAKSIFSQIHRLLNICYIGLIGRILELPLNELLNDWNADIQTYHDRRRG